MTVGPVAADGHARVLADGNQMPMLGLGVWQVPNGPECVNAIRWALDLGYRHIDTAQAYGNEESVGKALRDSGMPRDQVFITTKFYPRRKDPVAEAQQSLRRLGVDQVDLYLIHWPQGGALWAWPGMQRAHELGFARSIGISNFSARELEEVIEEGTIPPAVNQVQFSSLQYRRALLDACQRRSVALEAYSPLGTGRHLSNETVYRVAQRVGRTPAQVLLRWCLQHDLPVIPKSTHRERIHENAQIFDFALSNEDMAQLDPLDQTNGTDRALERKWW
jgi:diketogulonate reductase-like aldo/keto reductase